MAVSSSDVDRILRRLDEIDDKLVIQQTDLAVIKNQIITHEDQCRRAQRLEVEVARISERNPPSAAKAGGIGLAGGGLAAMLAEIIRTFGGSK